MKKHLLILCLCGLISCELVVELERPDFNPSIVVGSVISPDEPVSVWLNEDLYILDGGYNTRFEPIEGATVLLYEDELLIGQLEYMEGSDDFFNSSISSAHYAIAHLPQEGSSYTIQVEKEGFTDVKAVEQIPSDSAVFSVTYESSLSEWEIIFNLNITIEDSEGEDYYEFNLYREFNEPVYELDEMTGEYVLLDSVRKNRFREYLYFEQEILFEEHLNNLWIFDDKLFKNDSYDLAFTYRTYVDAEQQEFDYDNKLVVEIRKVSEAYFNYYNTVMLQSWVEGDPFSEPVQVFSNVENGKGILGSYVSGEVEIDL